MKLEKFPRDIREHAHALGQLGGFCPDDPLRAGLLAQAGPETDVRRHETGFDQPDVAAEKQVYFAAGTQMPSATEKSTPATSVRTDMYCSPAFLSGFADTVSRY